jgi:hypothetical protein
MFRKTIVPKNLRSKKLSPRRLTIVDWWLLIALVGSWIIVTQAFLKNEGRFAYSILGTQPWMDEFETWWPLCLFGLVPRYIALGMVCLLAMRLRRPRPNLRSLSRQPGAVACAAAAAAMAAGGIVVLSLLRPVDDWYFLQDHPEAEHPWQIVVSRVSMAVPAAWFILAWSGRWRSEPSWIDRMGRVLGAYWIGLLTYHCYLLTIYH